MVNQQSDPWLYKNPRRIGILVTIFLSIFAAIVCFFGYQNIQKNAEREVQNTLNLLQQNILQSLNQCYNAALALSHTIDQNGTPKDFESKAAAILRKNPTLDVLQLVPNGIIEYTFPLKGNEVVLGYNILEDEMVGPEVREAIKRKEIFFAGPFELRQGGLAVVGRLPIFINGEFWGLAAVIIKVHKLLGSLGIINDEKNGFYFQFSKINPLTGEEEHFLPSIDHLNPIASSSYYFEQGNWNLKILKTTNGYDLIGFILLVFFSFGFAFISGAFVRSILKKPVELQYLLEENAGKLSKSEERNKAILNALPDILFIADREGKLLDFHRSKHMSSFISTENILYKNIKDVFGEVISDKALKNINQALKSKQLLIHEFQLNDSYLEARYIKSGAAEVLIILRNVTDRVLQINAVEEQNEKLRNIARIQSHEIRAPLARMMGIIQWLDKEKDVATQKNLLGHIITSANELDEIIGEISKKTIEINLQR